MTTYPIWKMVTRAVLATALVFGWSTSGRADETADTEMTVADGKQVSLEYTLTLGNGTAAGSNVGQEPLVYVHGKGEIVKGLEKELTGLKKGDKKKVVVSPQDGYGAVDPNRTQQVPLDKIPEDARKVGAQLRGMGPGGQMMFAKVTQIDDKTATIDLNHPLAGQELTFDVTVVKVEEAGNPITMPAPVADPTKAQEAETPTPAEVAK